MKNYVWCVTCAYFSEYSLGKLRLVKLFLVLTVVLTLFNMESQKYVTLGKSMGLEGKELIMFVQSREAKDEERDERAMERKHVKEMKELEIKLEESKKQAKASKHDTKQKMKQPKLPNFNDGRDDMDSFLRRFEQFAITAEWPKEDWACSLSSLLTGKALEVYARLPVDQANDFQALKSALLHRYQLTEEGFRLKLRTSKPEIGETFLQFSIRLGSYLNRWIELGNGAKSYDGLSDLILREQILAACDKDLALYLKERKPNSCLEMTQLADRYMEAHRRLGSENTIRRYPRVSNDPKINDRDSKPKTYTVQGDKTGFNENRDCFVCGKKGHIARNCRYRTQSKYRSNKPQTSSLQVPDEGETQASKDDDVEVAGCITKKSALIVRTGNLGNLDKPKGDFEIPLISAACTVGKEMPVRNGYVGDKMVSVLRDSGCSTVVVKRDLVCDSQLLDTTQKCVLLDGTIRCVPVAHIFIDTPYFVGSINALCMPNPLYGLILGNITGARDPQNPNPNWKRTTLSLNNALNDASERSCEHTPEKDVRTNRDTPMAAVETRAQKVKRAKDMRPLSVPEAQCFFESRADVIQAQLNDKSLAKCWNLANEGKVQKTGLANEVRYFTSDRLLLREFKSPTVNTGRPITQMIVPESLRPKVLKLAHDTMMSGHLGTTKTTDRVLANFFWPGAQGDVRRYCVSCDICQRTVAKGRVGRVPLGRMPLIDTPFRRVAVDIVGPIDPVTHRGNRYILTLVDYASRYPEAVPLPRIEAERVAEALLEIFSRVGIPHEILSDMGTQFTSNLMKEVSRLLSLKQLHTTPYHPICNGLVEKFNGTLKRMLRKMCCDRPRDWDRYIPALLFAYRECPQESLGYSPFELIYGRAVRGPLTILKELWTETVEDEEVKSTYQYVIDLQDRLKATCKLAQNELAKSSARYKKYYDTRTKDRTFSIGDQVLVLLPTDSNKLLMQWKGPFYVVKRVAHHDFCIDMNGKERTFHANLLKRYVTRHEIEPEIVHAAYSLKHVSTSVIDEDETTADMPELKLFPVEQTEGWTDVQICPDITAHQIQKIQQMLKEFSDVLTDIPGCTDLIEHSVVLTTDNAIYSKAYPVPFATQETITNEVDTMLKIGVIERSLSKYASPIVLVRKKDGSNRFCVDFRKLNRVTIFDPEPMPNIESLMGQVGDAKFFTKLDLTMGYWQIPISDHDKDKTAFITPQGLFQFTVLPFGMINAPATFTRMMRKLLEGQSNVVSFIDDVLIFTYSFDEHLRVIGEVLERLRTAKLTAKPSKCKIAYSTLEFLGHVIGNGKLLPQPEKIVKILNASRPCTKKQVRSFMGLINYYRKFVPNFAAIAAPLTDLTKKGNPTRVHWDQAQENAFETLKSRLESAPILHLPDHSRSYILRTDASDIGIGAVLLQQDGDQFFPIAYASRKLLPRETAYAVIERECLALVWGIAKFHIYLYGKQFLVETDHHPLAYLTTAKVNNSRCMRWALGLQQYRFNVKAIKGTENIGADFLSRCPGND